jgi:hypothetical protein
MTEYVSLIIKKNEIKDNICELVYEDRLYVLQILKQQLPSSKIIEHGDGCRINLDNLSLDVINKIYHIINTRLKISNDHQI